MEEPKVVYADEDVQIATWSNVFINRWVSPAKKHLLIRLGDLQEEHIQSVPRGRVAVFTILSQSTSLMPDAEARKEAERVARRHADSIALSAQIVEGDGFLAAIARTMLTGVNMAIRNPYPTRVFRSIDESMSWFCDQLRSHEFEGDADGFADAIRSLADRQWGLDEDARGIANG